MNKAFFENNYLILSHIWKNRYKLMLTPIIFSFVFAFFHSMIPEKYEVGLSMLIQDTDELNPQLSDLSTSPLQRKTIFYEHLIKSDQVLNSALKEIGYQDKNTSEYRDRIRSGLNFAQTSYGKNDRNVFKVSFKWNTNEDIVKVFLAINESFVDAFNNFHIEAIQKSRSFINSQLKIKKEEILASEKKIIDFKLKHKDIATELMAFDYKENAALEQKIIEKEIEYLGVKEKYEVLQKQLLRDNPVKKMIEEKISNHRKTLSNHRLVYTEEHSLVLKEKELIKELEQELQKMETESSFNLIEIKDFLSQNEGVIPYFLIDKIHELENLKVDKNRTERELSGLNKLKEEQQKGLQDFGDLYIQLRDLEQDLEIKEERYNKLLEKEEAIKITEELKKFEQMETIQIMNQSSIEIKSLKLPKIIYTVGGVIFGVFLILSVSILGFMLNQNVIKKKEVEEILETIVISRVPHITKKKKERFYESNTSGGKTRHWWSRKNSS